MSGTTAQTPAQIAETQRIAAERQAAYAAERAQLPPEPEPPATATAPVRSEEEIKAERDARIAASHGAQVILDPMSEVALAARGALHGTMQGNLVARDAALVARAGDEPVVIAHPPVLRDVVGDPEPDTVLASRGVPPVKPVEPAVVVPPKPAA